MHHSAYSTENIFERIGITLKQVLKTTAVVSNYFEHLEDMLSDVWPTIQFSM